MTAKAEAPDVKQLASEDKLPEQAFPVSSKMSYRVFFDPGVHQACWQHGTEDVSVEICGVLVGRVLKDANGPFLHIDASIRGEKAASKFAEVTFTHDTWSRIHEQMDSKYADRSIVGWYHSHPDFGVFLSDRDRFIQEHFFSGPGQVAYVIDPVRKTEGVFIWRSGKAVLTDYYWVGDSIQLSTAGGDERRTMPASKGEAPASGGSAPRPAAAGGPRELGWLSIASNIATLVLLFVLGYLFAGKASDWERARIEEKAYADAMLNLQLRLGLEDELRFAARELAYIVEEAQAVAQEHVKGAEDPKQATKQWNSIQQHLINSLGTLQKIQYKYCLTEKEIENVRKELERRGVKIKASKDDKDKTKQPDKDKAKEPEKDKAKEPEKEKPKEPEKAKEPEKPKESEKEKAKEPEKSKEPEKEKAKDS